MNKGSRNPLKSIRDDVLKAVLVATGVAFATGLAGGIISGAWQKALLAASGLAIVVLGVILVAAAAWHRGELDEVNYQELRAKDVAKRQLPRYEREQQGLVNQAATQSRDLAGVRTDLNTMLERGRKQMAKARPSSSVELLLLDDSSPLGPAVVAQAGRFDQQVLSDPNRLQAMIDEQGDCAFNCSVPALGELWRLVVIRDVAVDEHDRWEAHHLANLISSLKLAHRIRQIGAMEESA